MNTMKLASFLESMEISTKDAARLGSLESARCILIRRPVHENLNWKFLVPVPMRVCVFLAPLMLEWGMVLFLRICCCFSLGIFFFCGRSGPAVLWSRGPLVPPSFGPRSSGPLVLWAFPFYLLLLLGCSFLLVRACAFLLLCSSASLFCSSGYLLFRCSFCLLPLFAYRFLLDLASAFLLFFFLLRCVYDALLCSSAFLLVGFTFRFPPSSFSSCSALILSALLVLSCAETLSSLHT